MSGLDEIDARVISDFLSEFWESFVSHCEDRGEDAEKILSKLNGEKT